MLSNRNGRCNGTIERERARALTRAQPEHRLRLVRNNIHLTQGEDVSQGPLLARPAPLCHRGAPTTTSPRPFTAGGKDQSHLPYLLGTGQIGVGGRLRSGLRACALT